MTRWLIVLVLLLAAFALALEVLGTVCPWLSVRERCYVLGLSVAVFTTLQAAWQAGVVS